MEGVSDPVGPFLHRPRSPLPDARDFDPWDGNLDAFHAWKHFGGLSLVQAYKLFLENPVCWQEDFMFMGPKAFAYYFPVIDRYLREVSGEEPDYDCCAGILGFGIAEQLRITDPAIPSVAREVADLAVHVLANPGRYTSGEREQQHILREWRKVAKLAEAFVLP
jgi:hypothetical protein